MIRVDELANGDLLITHSLLRPSIYLDHWAVMDFSQNQSLSARLRDAIERHNGTLAVSWLNFVEFAGMTDTTQASVAESFVDGFMPRVFLLEADPYRGWPAEVAGLGPTAPVAANDFLKEIIKESCISGRHLSLSGIIQTIQASTLGNNLSELGAAGAEAFMALLNQMETDSTKRKAGTAPTPVGRLSDPLAFVRREFIRKLLIAKGTSVTPNDAIDFFHATAAVAYCTHALLDAQWVAWTSEIKANIARARRQDPFATVFSRRANGVSRFLEAIEADT